MSEGQNVKSYRDLVEEVYLAPIRSAILIDDDFPTLDEYLDGTAKDKRNASKLTELLGACRGSPNHWLVDVHDGKKNPSLDEMEKYKHLHQSDLMILDYHLDGDAGGNDKAIQVLRSLAQSNYFNLAVIYTSCASSIEEKTRVLEIVRSLIANTTVRNSAPVVPEAVIAWEIAEDTIVERLKGSFEEKSFLWLIQEEDIGSSSWNKRPDFAELNTLISARQKAIKTNIGTEVMSWLVSDRAYSVKNCFSERDLGRIEFSIDTPSVNWIRTNNLFMTVINKSTEASKIRNILLDSLSQSIPSPHRLLMTKMRNILEEKGMAAEAAVLRRGNIQAGLLAHMLEAEEHQRPWEIKQTIGRHWEQLSAEINLDISSYASKLFENVFNENTCKKTTVEKYTGIDLHDIAKRSLASAELNSYLCSKDVGATHLTTGLIFAFKRGDESPEIMSREEGIARCELEYWVCLSPACDLVPGQRQRWGKNDTRPFGVMPFKAVKLFPRKVKNALEQLTTNESIFIRTNNKIECFTFSDQFGANPIWEQFFAHDNGLLSNNRIEFSSVSVFKPQESGIHSQKHEAEVVAQLRYEYAINLIQKLGTSLSRVGLDFISLD